MIFDLIETLVLAAAMILTFYFGVFGDCDE